MSFLKQSLICCLGVIMATGSLSIRAESINPPTVPQTAPMNAAETANLDIVLKWWREVLQGRHAELAPAFQAKNYIQHDPNIPTGRAAFVAFVKSMGPPVEPMPKRLSPAPVVKGAKGDFVWLVFEHEKKDPKDPSRTYYFYSFDILRLKNGKIQEHWDSSRKRLGTPPFIAPDCDPPSHWNTGTLSFAERRNLAIATEELKDILQYGHLELADKVIAEGYIQHNPNVPQGREGFKHFMSQFAGRKPQQIKQAWKSPPVLTLVNGPYVLMMWNRTAKDPADPKREYTWNHFDLLRVENGLAKEHWDEAEMMPAPAQERHAH